MFSFIKGFSKLYGESAVTVAFFAIKIIIGLVIALLVMMGGIFWSASITQYFVRQVPFNELHFMTYYVFLIGTTMLAFALYFYLIFGLVKYREVAKSIKTYSKSLFAWFKEVTVAGKY